MKTLIFDFDGTIADSFDFVFDLLADAGPSNRHYTQEERRPFHYKSMPRMAHLLGVKWWRLPLMLHRGRKRMRHQLSEVSAFPEMPPLIRELHGQKYRLMILSSNIEPTIRDFLRRHEIDEYFETVQGQVGIFGKGPALRRLMARYAISTRDCLYIGDETRDVKSAKSVGMDCVAVTWGFADPTDLRKLNPFAVVASAPELRAAIAKFSAK